MMFSYYTITLRDIHCGSASRDITEQSKLPQLLVRCDWIYIQSHFWMLLQPIFVIDSIDQNPKMISNSKSSISQLQNKKRIIKIGLETSENETDENRLKACHFMQKVTSTFFPNPIINRRHPAKFSFSCHFFVSRWILLRVGDLDLINLVEFFCFLFLGFQCYHAVANLLQSLCSQ